MGCWDHDREFSFLRPKPPEKPKLCFECQSPDVVDSPIDDFWLCLRHSLEYQLSRAKHYAMQIPELERKMAELDGPPPDRSAEILAAAKLNFETDKATANAWGTVEEADATTWDELTEPQKAAYLHEGEYAVKRAK